MKKITYIITLLAIILLASCRKDDAPSTPEPTGVPICFSGESADFVVTRTGDNKIPLSDMIQDFTVYGINGNVSGSTFNKATGIVFPNYKVQYTANSAHTTNSNSSNWEYVLTNGSFNQTIKYWDDSQNAHYFWAIGNADKGTFVPTSDGGKATFDTNGLITSFTTTISSTDDANSFYYSDPVCRQSSTTRLASSQGPVELTFHRFCSKVRVGFYEALKNDENESTVSSLKFYAVNDNGTFNTTESNTAPLNPDDAVYLSGVFPTQVNAVLNYRYSSANGDDVSLTNPKVEATATTSTSSSDQHKKSIGVVRADFDNFASSSLSPAWVVTGTSQTVTSDDAQLAYFNVLPIPTDATARALSIMCDYTIKNKTTGHEQEFKKVMATVPADYTKWQPGYAYTYIFKITEKGNVVLADVKVAVWDWNEGNEITQEWHNW